MVDEAFALKQYLKFPVTKLGKITQIKKQKKQFNQFLIKMPHKQILVGIIAKTRIDMIMKISWILALLIFFSSCLPSQKEKNFFQSGEWVDLSYSFDEQTIYWPTSLAFKLDTVFAGRKEKEGDEVTPSPD